MACPTCGQVAGNVVDYEVHRHLGHQAWYVQVGARVLGTLVPAAPRLISKLT